MQDLNTNMGNEGITFCSWNVKGINEPVKRGKVLAHLKALKVDVAFIQETHLKKDAEHRLKAKWIDKVYHSSFTHKSRGVAILFRKGTVFKHTSTINDSDGRYIIVIGELNAQKMIFVNVYGPNFDSPLFFKKIFNTIPELAQHNLIIGGDLNCTLDSYLDRSSKQRKIKSHSSDFTECIHRY